MPRNINDRISQLNTRRKGTDRLERLSLDARIGVLIESQLEETWQKRARAQPYTQYAIGAMQAVTDRYTQIGIETAQRVGKQLADGLSRPVNFELQGSVPLDVHIRGVSDVDLLTLDRDFLVYDALGARSQAGLYRSPTHLTSVGVLSEMRREAETLLRAKYPAATIDCSGGKCISLSGGSLARPVDVVPSHWHDTSAFQRSEEKHDRGVYILNKKVPETLGNLPFLHMKCVHDRDTSLLGGLKKAIRLTKNVKNDAEHQSLASRLPSFDITALLYHADHTALIIGCIYELAIVREVQRFLDWCYHNKSAAKLLRTPDDLRFVLDTEAKFEGLTTISVEMDALARDVAKEQDSAFRSSEAPTWDDIDRILRSTRVPEAV